MKCSTCGAGNNFDALPFTCEYCGARNLLKNHSLKNNPKHNNKTHSPGDYINKNDENRIEAIQFYKNKDYEFAQEYFNNYLESNPDDFQVWVYQIRCELKLFRKSNFLDKFDLIADKAEKLTIRLEKLKVTKTEETEDLPNEDQYDKVYDYLKKAQQETKRELHKRSNIVRYDFLNELRDNSHEKDSPNLAIKHIKIIKRSHKYYFTKHEHLVSGCFNDLDIIFEYLKEFNLKVDDEIKYYIDELSYMNKHGKYTKKITKELIDLLDDDGIIAAPNFFLEYIKNIPNLKLHEGLFGKARNKNDDFLEEKKGCSFVEEIMLYIVLAPIVIFFGWLFGWF